MPVRVSGGALLWRARARRSFVVLTRNSSPTGSPSPPAQELKTTLLKETRATPPGYEHLHVVRTLPRRVILSVEPQLKWGQRGMSLCRWVYMSAFGLRCSD